MFSNRCPQCHPDDLYWTGTIIVSVTIAADGAIKDAQARINKGVPAHFYRSDTLLNLSRRPCPRLDSVLLGPQYPEQIQTRRIHRPMV
jgi:hypothetical protein